MRGTILDLIGHGYPDKLLILIPKYVRMHQDRVRRSTLHWYV
jgi:hypothetical protein